MKHFYNSIQKTPEMAIHIAVSGHTAREENTVCCFLLGHGSNKLQENNLKRLKLKITVGRIALG